MNNNNSNNNLNNDSDKKNINKRFSKNMTVKNPSRMDRHLNLKL